MSINVSPQGAMPQGRATRSVYTDGMGNKLADNGDAGKAVRDLGNQIEGIVVDTGIADLIRSQFGSDGTAAISDNSRVV